MGRFRRIMVRNLSVSLLLVVLIPIFYSESYADNKLYNKINGNGFELKYHNPIYLFKDPINYYSFIHFVEYSALSLIRSVKLIHMLFISVIWEIIELFIPNEWARESWANKFCDLVFNFFGFYFCRRLLNKKTLSSKIFLQNYFV